MYSYFCRSSYFGNVLYLYLDGAFDVTRFTLRLPDKIDDQLTASAAKAKRSKTAHIVWILQTYLAAEKIRKPMADEVWLAMRKRQ